MGERTVGLEELNQDAGRVVRSVATERPAADPPELPPAKPHAVSVADLVDETRSDR